MEQQKRGCGLMNHLCVSYLGRDGEKVSQQGLYDTLGNALLGNLGKGILVDVTLAHTTY